MDETWKTLAVSEGISLGTGVLSALCTMGTMERYGMLRQPPLSPPGWVFPVVWTGLFALMGVSAWRVWQRSGGKRRRRALLLYGLQLAVNFTWPILFFRLGAYGPAFFWLLLLLALVSMMAVNNEVGSILPIKTAARVIRRNKARTLLHVDAVQAFGKLPLKPGKIGVDLMTVSAHKIHGPKGAGALYIRKGVHIPARTLGGGQENGLRSGTENTFAIKQFEFAAKKKFSSLKEDFERIRSYNLAVRQGLDKTIFRVLSSENASPYVLSVSARGLRGEVLLHMLDDAGVMVGTGSACSSKNRYSRVILACGLDERSADGVLRISFAATTTLQETEQAIGIINSCAASLAERTK